MTVKTTTPPLVLVALLIAALVPATAEAAHPPVDAGSSKLTVAEVSAYWTPQRMATARETDLTIDASGGGATEPQPRAGSIVSFVDLQLTDTLSFPNRVHGKVFFSRPSGGNYVCSGTAVTSENRSTVITAGHCVNDGENWSTNFAFAPGYRNLNGAGNAPYGVWPATEESAPGPWVGSQNFRYDVGVAVVAHNSSGQTLEDAVGARGIAFNQPTDLSYRSHGYPAVPYAGMAFDGTRLWACDSGPPIAITEGGGRPATLGIGCDMTGGASGGGWVMTDPSGASFVNGVNSYRYLNQPEILYGPYFGSTIEDLYDHAAAESPGTQGSPAAGNAAPAPVVAQPPRPICKKSRKHSKSKRGRKHACAKHL